MEKVTTMNKAVITELAAEICGVQGAPFAAYLIGGGALAVQDLQEGTKDIDLIAPDPESLIALVERTEQLGYRIFLEPQGGAESVRLQSDKPVSVIRDDVLIDVFVRRTTHFTLTESMVSRSIPLAEQDGGRFRVVSAADIMVLKTATGRQTDAQVFKRLLRAARPDWQTVLAEVEAQCRDGNHRAPHDVLLTLVESGLATGDEIPSFVSERLIAMVQQQLDTFPHWG